MFSLWDMVVWLFIILTSGVTDLIAASFLINVFDVKPKSVYERRR